MADRSKQSLVAYDKSGAKVATGGVGTKQVEITGLEGGKEVAKGDYQLAYTDGTNTSDKVDVPAFTVLTGTVTEPKASVTNNLAVGTDTPFTMTGDGSENEIKRMYSLSKPIAKGTTVTADFDIESTKAEGNYMVQFANEPWQVISSAPLTAGTQHQSYTVTADADYSDGIQLRMDKSTSTVTVSNFVISESSK
ncbi:hypothetical protein [Pediococcus acidilactici]|uniref:hypothetical protein n=1 Tax=Pediococcus acidilactici TaxID=1254 RepID=UPI003D76B60A